jgi:hypothetical protein
LNLEITDKDGKPYIAADTDNILFTVKKDVNLSEFIFQKKVYNNQINIEPQDTKDLPYGKYVYDVQLTTAAGYVDTIITPHAFSVLGEVT